MNARKLSDQERREIAALKATGKSSASIAVKFKVSNAAVRRIAARAGIAVEGRGNGDVQRDAPTADRPAQSGLRGSEVQS